VLIPLIFMAVTVMSCSLGKNCCSVVHRLSVFTAALRGSDIFIAFSIGFVDASPKVHFAHMFIEWVIQQGRGTEQCFLGFIKIMLSSTSLRETGE